MVWYVINSLFCVYVCVCVCVCDIRRYYYTSVLLTIPYLLYIGCYIYSCKSTCSQRRSQFPCLCVPTSSRNRRFCKDGKSNGFWRLWFTKLFDLSYHERLKKVSNHFLYTLSLFFFYPQQFIIILLLLLLFPINFTSIYTKSTSHTQQFTPNILFYCMLFIP